MAKQHPLSRIRLLAGLSDEQLQSIEEIGQYRTYAAGDTIFTEGEEGTHAYCLLSGRVELSVALGDSTEQAPVHIASPGSVFGEFVLFERTHRTATARAARSAYILVVTSESLQAVFAADPQAGYVVMSNLCRILVERVRKTTKDLRASLMW